MTTQPPTTKEQLLLYLDERKKASTREIMRDHSHLNLTTVRWTLNNILVKKEGLAYRPARSTYALTVRGLATATKLRLDQQATPHPLKAYEDTDRKKQPSARPGTSSDDPYEILRFILTYRQEKGKSKVDRAFDFAKSLDP